MLVRIAYQSAQLPYHEYAEGNCPPVVELNSARSGGPGSYFAFCHISGFIPTQMEVQRASQVRGEIPARVCLLGRDKTVYKMYALPDDLAEGSNQ